jgi:hypothetical protein
MIIYFRGYKNGYQQFQAFHKINTAVEYVINKIEGYLGGARSSNSYLQPKKKLATPRLRGMAAAPPAYILGNPFDQPQQVAVLQEQHLAEPNNLYDNPAPMYNFSDFTTSTKPTTIVANKELQKLQTHIEITKKNMTLENATKAIELYEQYNNSIPGSDESALHTLQDIKVVN